MVINYIKTQLLPSAVAFQYVYHLKWSSTEIKVTAVYYIINNNFFSHFFKLALSFEILLFFPTPTVIAFHNPI